MTPAPEGCPSAGTLKTDPPVPVKASEAWDGSDHLQRAAGAVSSRGGRAGVIAGIRSSLPAALYGPQQHSCAGAEYCQVGEHLDDEHDPGGLGFGGDAPETLLKRGRWPWRTRSRFWLLNKPGRGWLCVVPCSP